MGKWASAQICILAFGGAVLFSSDIAVLYWLAKKGTINSLEAIGIGHPIVTLLYSLFLLSILAILQMRRGGIPGMIGHLRRVLIEVVLTAVLAWLPFFVYFMYEIPHDISLQSPQVFSIRIPFPPEQLAILSIEQPRVRIISDVSARCDLPKDLSACEIKCSISNAGNDGIRDVVVGFQGSLPLLTQAYADADFRVSLEKSPTLPLPDASGNIRKDEVAFTIRIPLIPPGVTVPFVLKTVSEDNQKACQQVLRMQEIRKRVNSDFYAALINSQAVRPTVPDLDALNSAQAVAASLFLPGQISSEIGRGTVMFLTQPQKRALDTHTNILNEFRSNFQSVLQWKERCVAPVWTVEQTNGGPFRFWRMPPQSQADLGMNGLTTITMPDGKTKMVITPVPPSEYYCR